MREWCDPTSSPETQQADAVGSLVRMWILVAGYLIAAVLPIIGFARLLWRTQRVLDRESAAAVAAHSDAMSWDAFDGQFESRTDGPRRDRNAVLWDIALVGSGLVLGAATSIAALPWD